MDIKVSIIIPTYNRADLIGATLDTVFAQTFPPHEVIVVDDGSQDQLGAALERFRDRIVCIRIVNSGVNVARNTGAAAATGNWLCFLDSDDLLFPRFLQRQVRLIETAGNLQSTIVDIRNVRDGVWSEKTHFSFAPSGFWDMKTRDFGNLGFVIDESMAAHLPFFQPTIPSASMISRALFQEMGIWDPRAKPGYAQDTEFHFRQLHRAPIGVVPEALTGYRKHAGSTTVDDLRDMEITIQTWEWIASELQLGRQFAAEIHRGNQEKIDDLLVSAFYSRRFDFCRKWKSRASGKLSWHIQSRLLLTDLPDPVLRMLTRLVGASR